MTQQIRNKLEILNSNLNQLFDYINKLLDNTPLPDDTLQVIEEYLDHYINIYNSIDLLLRKNDVSKEDFKQITDGLNRGIQMLDEI